LSEQKRIVLQNLSPNSNQAVNNLTDHLLKAQQNLAMTMLSKTRNPSASPEVAVSKLTYSINLVDDSLKKKKKHPSPLSLQQSD